MVIVFSSVIAGAPLSNNTTCKILSDMSNSHFLRQQALIWEIGKLVHVVGVSAEALVLALSDDGSVITLLIDGEELKVQNPAFDLRCRIPEDYGLEAIIELHADDEYRDLVNSFYKAVWGEHFNRQSSRTSLPPSGLWCSHGL